MNIDLVEEIAKLLHMAPNKERLLSGYWAMAEEGEQQSCRDKARQLIKDSGYVKLAKDQTPPENPYQYEPNQYQPTGWVNAEEKRVGFDDGVKACRNEGWCRVELPQDKQQKGAAG